MIKISKLWGIVGFICSFSALAAPPAPTITNATSMTRFTWVLIHAPVSFLVPARTLSAEGTASFQWNSVSGASSYQVRTFINGVWSDWQSVGSNTYYNLSGASGNVGFEVRACDASGCSAAASTTIIATAWKNVGVCDPRTNQQAQVCVNSSLCTLNSTRTVTGNCVQSVDCN